MKIILINRVLRVILVVSFRVAVKIKNYKKIIIYKIYTSNINILFYIFTLLGSLGIFSSSALF